MKTIYFLIGKIGSGKSFWSQQYVKANSNTRIISKDALREMYFGTYKYDPEFESYLDIIVIDLIEDLLNQGYGVIVDGCHLTKEHRRRILEQIRTDIVEEIKVIAVVTPNREKDWHLNNRSQNLRTYTLEEWAHVYDIHFGVFEPFINLETEPYFDDVIYTKSF